MNLLSSQPPRPKSALHRKVVGLLRELFPSYRIEEEASLQVSLGGRVWTVFVDITVQDLNLAIECHGRQHYEFVPHFHGSRDEFARSLERDRAKAQAILDAGMSYLAIPYSIEAKLTRGGLRALIRAMGDGRCALRILPTPFSAIHLFIKSEC
jgi:hypothetical protein